MTTTLCRGGGAGSGCGDRGPAAQPVSERPVWPVLAVVAVGAGLGLLVRRRES